MDRKDIFQKIYDEGIWMDSGDAETPAGPGSNRGNAKKFVEELNDFIARNKIKSILDVGCGASNWQEDINLSSTQYLGIDIINLEKKLPFKQHDIIESIPEGSYDLIIMRNFLQHQKLFDIKIILRHIVKMNPRFVIANYQNVEENNDIKDDDIYHYRPVNLTIKPFNLPIPIDQLNNYGSPMGVWLYKDFTLRFHEAKSPHDVTVLIAILAKNKAHTLPHYLECIKSQTFPSNKITLYIRTNNNKDETKEILTKFCADNNNKYHKIIYDDSNITEANEEEKPHEWTSERFNILGKIRQKSLEICLKEKCDYYFVVDCDNFITPETLDRLLNARKDIVAPMLKPFPKPNDVYSNFFADIDEDGFCKNSFIYHHIFNKVMVGPFRVPVVHCTYLIDAKCIPKLSYIDGSGSYEFIIFSRTARRANVEQFILNTIDFGELLHPEDNVSLEEEKIIMKEFLDKNMYVY